MDHYLMTNLNLTPWGEDDQPYESGIYGSVQDRAVVNKQSKTKSFVNSGKYKNNLEEWKSVAQRREQRTSVPLKENRIIMAPQKRVFRLKGLHQNRLKTEPVSQMEKYQTGREKEENKNKKSMISAKENFQVIKLQRQSTQRPKRISNNRVDVFQKRDTWVRQYQKMKVTRNMVLPKIELRPLKKP